MYNYCIVYINFSLDFVTSFLILVLCKLFGISLLFVYIRCAL